MLGHVDAPSKQLPLLLVRRVEVQVEAALEDAVDVGCVRPMEEQHLSHLLLRVDLPSLLELQLLGVVVLQGLVIPVCSTDWTESCLFSIGFRTGGFCY